MATIDLTLDSFKVPAIENYTPPFGTKIVKTDANKGGLSTVEVNSNIMMPFANMRPKVITENSSTTEIEYDAKLCFSSSLLAGATLELDDGAYEGCRLQVTNLSSFACDVEYNSATLVSIPTGANVEVLWTGSSWMLSTTGTVASGNVMAPTSAAVHAAIRNTLALTQIVLNNYTTTNDTTFTASHTGFVSVYKYFDNLSSYKDVRVMDSNSTVLAEDGNFGSNYCSLFILYPITKGETYIVGARKDSGSTTTTYKAVAYYFDD